MNPEYSVLLYSKYSNNCKNLTTMITDNNVQIPLQYVCIDNKDVRKRIMDSTKIKIRFVPCILNVFKNGVVELYEGTQAFVLIKNIIQSLTPPKPMIPPENIINTEIKTDYISPSETSLKKSKKNVNKPQKIENQKTFINDLDDNDEEEEINNMQEDEFEEEDNENLNENIEMTFKKPKKGIRKGAINEEFEEDIFSDEQPSIIDSSSKTAVKKSSNKYTNDKKDIQSRAQDLAKEREIDEKVFKNKGGAIPSDMRRP